ncbi:MAG: fumarylacetoacetase [Blastocatellia bacterium]|nr:fumarylacetoacetase [Chloracidobacterium sp.]MBL8184647.1 fumarylacetoacetase [Blastocatellia bacterium]HRJ87292.1 fumarylacetoacetase [Pyrinomonadaceae bacterium]HRK52179.1 fumarylacetoacetase [Pyrinomonadaceae bacterium]
MHEINETHDPNLKSWVESANDPNTDFPIQNLPFCVIGNSKAVAIESIGVAIGDRVLDLAALEAEWLDGTKLSFLKDVRSEVYPSFADDPGLDWSVMHGDLASGIRRRVSDLLRHDNPSLRDHPGVERAFRPLTEAYFRLPVDQIGDYTDFYSSIYHATNVGSMFRPDNPLLPNYKYVPIGYHGRASSIVISGTDIKRPKGQNRSDAEKPPVFIPAKNLDYEMELGFFVGRGNELGSSIAIGEAEEHIFGVCLVNDWSARDIQAWEYQPLGPFLAKNFATTISPYVVTMEALAPFRTKAFERDADDPQPLDYLNGEQNQKLGGLDINLEVYIQTEKMRAESIEPHMLSRSNTKDLYWTIGQMLTHHASNGCNLQTGDLMATGTVSGKEKSERGCMLELTWRGTEPIELPSGEQRRFLEDGDEIIMRGYCEREGFRRIGLGECRGRILPAD